MLLTSKLLTNKRDSFNGPLGIKGILFSHETAIIRKQVENLIKASRKLNKDIMFPKSKSIFWKYSVTIK